MLRAIFILLTLSAGLLEADVTVRYTAEFKSSLPGAMQQAAAQLKSAMPAGTVLRIKGSKSYTEYGAMRAVADSSTKQMTLLDPDRKKFATTDADQYLKAVTGAIPKMPDGIASIIASFKMKTASKLTGRTATIQGIGTEEREIELSVEAPATQGMPAGPLVRVVIQVWMSKESEMERVPALREWAAYNHSAISSANPASSLKKVFDMLPGMANGLSDTLQELTKPTSVMMRMHFDLFMPAIAAAMKQMPAESNPLGTDFDPNGSLMQMEQQVAELSTEPVPDSAFQVPAEYTQEPIDEYMKALMGHFMPAAPAK